MPISYMLEEPCLAADDLRHNQLSIMEVAIYRLHLPTSLQFYYKTPIEIYLISTPLRITWYESLTCPLNVDVLTRPFPVYTCMFAY